MNEFDTFLKPEKPFMLVAHVKRTCDQQITWYETEDELLYSARSNTAVIPVYAIEIGSSREVKM